MNLSSLRPAKGSIKKVRDEVKRNIEKFARENYLMKKPDEDVYVVVEDEQD